MTRLWARVHWQKAVVGVAVTLAIFLGNGCGGGGGGGGNDNGNVAPPPTATSTTTPVPQPTATQIVPTSSTVVLELTAPALLQGIDLRVAYPTSAGNFAGSGEDVACTTDSDATFVKNDTDSGHLALLFASPTAMAFPVHVTCTFDEWPGHTLVPDELTPTVGEVTTGGTAGDPATLHVRVDSTPAR